MDNVTASDLVEMETLIKCEIKCEENIKTEIFDNLASEHEIYDLKAKDSPMEFKTSIKIEDTTNSGDLTDFLKTIDFESKTKLNLSTTPCDSNSNQKPLKEALVHNKQKKTKSKNRQKSIDNKSSSNRCKRKRKQKEDITFACGFCSETFAKSYEFFRHMESHSDGFNVTVNDCEEMDDSNNIKIKREKTPSKTTMRKHKNKNTTKSECMKNKRKNKRKKEYEVFQCERCDQTFTFKANLKRHMMLHADEREALRPVCDLCKNSYSKKSYLMQHIRTVHFKIKSDTVFVCDVCNQKVNTAYALRCHMQIHTGCKPFVCHFCNKGLSNKWNLKVHLKSCL